MPSKHSIPFFLYCLIVTSLFLGGCSRNLPAPKETKEEQVEIEEVEEVPEPPQATGANLMIGMLLERKDNAYAGEFIKGAKLAVKELGNIVFVYDAPKDGSEDRQKHMLQDWIGRDMDGIAVSPIDMLEMAEPMEKGKEKGIKIVSFDRKSLLSARSLSILNDPPEVQGKAIVENFIEDLGGPEAGGEIAIIPPKQMTMSLHETALLKTIQKQLENYPKFKTVAFLPVADDPKSAHSLTYDLVKSYPKLSGVIVLNPSMLQAIANSLEKLNYAGKIVTGSARGNNVKQLVSNGIVKSFVENKNFAIGYATIYSIYKLASGKLKEEENSTELGKLGTKEIQDGELIIEPFAIKNAESL